MYSITKNIVICFNALRYLSGFKDTSLEFNVSIIVCLYMCTIRTAVIMNQLFSLFKLYFLLFKKKHVLYVYLL